MGRASFCETHLAIRRSDGFHYAPKKQALHFTHPTLAIYRDDLNIYIYYIWLSLVRNQETLYHYAYGIKHEKVA